LHLYDTFDESLVSKMANASHGETLQTWIVGEWVGTWLNNNKFSIMFEPSEFEATYGLTTSGKFFIGNMNVDMEDRYTNEGGIYTLHDWRNEEGRLKITLNGDIALMEATYSLSRDMRELYADHDCEYPTFRRVRNLFADTRRTIKCSSVGCNFLANANLRERRSV
jgi:hypothetical protein